MRIDSTQAAGCYVSLGSWPSSGQLAKLEGGEGAVNPELSLHLSPLNFLPVVFFFSLFFFIPASLDLTAVGFLLRLETPAIYVFGCYDIYIL